MPPECHLCTFTNGQHEFGCPGALGFGSGAWTRMHRILSRPLARARERSVTIETLQPIELAAGDEEP